MLSQGVVRATARPRIIPKEGIGLQTFLLSLIAEAQKCPVGPCQTNKLPCSKHVMSEKWEGTKALVPVQTFCSSGPIAICVTGFSGWPVTWVIA